MRSYQAQALLQSKGKALVPGEYVVLDKRGQGGMRMVLKAEHRRMKRVVALTVLSPNLTRTAAAAVARIRREVQAAACRRVPDTCR